MKDNLEMINKQIRELAALNKFDEMEEKFEERMKIIDEIEEGNKKNEIRAEILEHDKKLFNFIKKQKEEIEKNLISNVSKNHANKKYDEY